MWIAPSINVLGPWYSLGLELSNLEWVLGHFEEYNSAELLNDDSNGGIRAERL
jgi:hypothetical protein